MVPYLPIIQAILPYVGPLVSAAAPIFTKKTGEATVDPLLQAKQITELQDFINKNAESIKLLAEQLEKAVAVIDEREAVGQQTLAGLREEIAVITEKQQTAEGAVHKLIKDGQITKFIAFGACALSLVAILVVLFK